VDADRTTPVLGNAVFKNADEIVEHCAAVNAVANNG